MKEFLQKTRDFSALKKSKGNIVKFIKRSMAEKFALLILCHVGRQAGYEEDKLKWKCMIIFLQHQVCF
jgi:hypothetical protein